MRSKKGDTLFILGSGGSLASLDTEIINQMQNNTTMSLNYSFLQNFIKANFHLIREIGVTNNNPISVQASDLHHLKDLLSRNPCYNDTVFLAQGGYHAWAPNLLIGTHNLPDNAKVFRFKNPFITRFGKLSNTLSAVTHGASSITDCINIGFILGFKRIVLCGVDLYDRRYFWHMPGAKFIPLPGITDAEVGEYGGRGEITARHRTSDRLVGQISEWSEELKARGVTLSVQNPKSLLASVLPVYSASENT